MGNHWLKEYGLQVLEMGIPDEDEGDLVIAVVKTLDVRKTNHAGRWRGSPTLRGVGWLLFKFEINTADFLIPPPFRVDGFSFVDATSGNAFRKSYLVPCVVTKIGKFILNCDFQFNEEICKHLSVAEILKYGYEEEKNKGD